MEPVLNCIKSRFATIVWQDENVHVRDAATEDELSSIESLLSIIDPSIEDVSAVKDLNKYPVLKNFMDIHVQTRHYGFQVGFPCRNLTSIYHSVFYKCAVMFVGIYLIL